MYTVTRSTTVLYGRHEFHVTIFQTTTHWSIRQFTNCLNTQIDDIIYTVQLSINNKRIYATNRISI